MNKDLKENLNKKAMKISLLIDEFHKDLKVLAKESEDDTIKNSPYPDDRNEFMQPNSFTVARQNLWNEFLSENIPLAVLQNLVKKRFHMFLLENLVNKDDK